MEFLKKNIEELLMLMAKLELNIQDKMQIRKEMDEFYECLLKYLDDAIREIHQVRLKSCDKLIGGKK